MGGLAHEIHTSERKSFKGCRLRWKWHFLDQWTPIGTPKPLEFGIAYHKAMEVLYDPEMWDWPDRTVVGELAVKTFVDECEKQFKTYMTDSGIVDVDAEVRKDYNERIELGKGMLRYYYQQQLPNNPEGFRPIKVEIGFEVPIIDPDTSKQLYCTCNTCFERWWATDEAKDLVAECHRVQGAKGFRPCGPEDHFVSTGGLPVVYAGRIDALVEDDEGQYWIVDWKLYRVDKLVLTPSGWVKMGDLKDGDYVVGRDGKPTRIVGCSPITRDEPVWEVELFDGTVIECSGDHKWTVYGVGNGRHKNLYVKTTEELAEPHVYNENYGIPTHTGPIKFERDVKLPMHPYVLGSLIGDGYFRGSQLTYSSKSGETVKLLEQYCGSDVTIKDSRYGGKSNQWRISGPWRDQLRELSLWGKRSAEKYIPEDYLFSSVEDRILLLQGLYDTDGLASTMRICTTSEQLSKDIIHLIRSLGGNARVSSSEPRKHNNGTTDNVREYFINFWVPESIEFCQLERKKSAPRRSRGQHKRGIRSVRKTNRVADMRCIAVDAPDCLYTVGDFVLTHNTAAQISKDEDEEFLQLDDQVGSYVWALRMILNLPIAGFVYHQQKKGFPQPPQRNKHQRLGCWYSVSKNQDTDYETYLETVKTEDPQAYAAGAYDAFLNYLRAEGIIFYKRNVVYKTDGELEAIGKDIYLETLDMIDPSLRIYRNSGRFSCKYCAFRQPCISRQRGDDYEYGLKTLYKREAPYYYRQQLGASTESKGGE